MFEILGLESRLVHIASAAGAGTMRADLQPAEGEIWIVCEAMGYHDNAGALNGRWSYGLAALRKGLDAWLAHASTDRISCYGKSQLSANVFHAPALPYTCDQLNFLQWSVQALLAGEYSYIDAIVYVLRGVRRLTP